MHYNRKKPTYEFIRRHSVQQLLNKPDSTLAKLERRIEKEKLRVLLSLAWIKGVIRLKKAMEDKK